VAPADTSSSSSPAGSRDADECQCIVHRTFTGQYPPRRVCPLPSIIIASPSPCTLIHPLQRLRPPLGVCIPVCRNSQLFVWQLSIGVTRVPHCADLSHTASARLVHTQPTPECVPLALFGGDAADTPLAEHTERVGVADGRLRRGVTVRPDLSAVWAHVHGVRSMCRCVAGPRLHHSSCRRRSGHSDGLSASLHAR
jgi:hypothetical protein